MKKILTALTLSAAAVLMTGCAGTTAPASTPTPTEEKTPEKPTLKVPPKIAGTSATVYVSGGKLPKDSRATVYRYDSGWDAGTPTCDDPKAEKREITLNGEGTFQPASFSVLPGVAHWVLVVDGYATPCGGEGSSTTVQVETALTVFNGDEAEPTKLGDEREVMIQIDSDPTPEHVTGKVNLLGPWKTLPEARAADCTTAKPAQTMPLNLDYTGVAIDSRHQVKPTEPGIYLITVKTDESEQSTAVDTCAANREKGDDLPMFQVAAG